MTYVRVIPRDLFNEADLLKCLGRLWLNLENISDHRARLGDEDGDHDGSRFMIEQDEASGALFVANLSFTVKGRPFTLSRPLNARSPWPLYATDEEDEETSVFGDADGGLSADFLRLIGVA